MSWVDLSILILMRTVAMFAAIAVGVGAVWGLAALVVYFAELHFLLGAGAGLFVCCLVGVTVKTVIEIVEKKSKE